MKKTARQSLLLSMVVTAMVCMMTSSAFGKENAIRVLATTFPVYQITRNVAQGWSGVSVLLMIPAEMGCPHDYALTPKDMQKLASADILVVNGLGMEEFLGTPVEKANPKLRIIDSSAGIDGLLQYQDEDAHHEEAEAEEEHDHEDHHHTGTNAHLFASPRMTALMAGSIARQLAELDPEGAKTYDANAKAYAEKMNRLADDASALGKRLVNNRIVTQHGVFDYLARDMGLTISAVVQAHAGQEPSASEMLAIIEIVRSRKVGAIFTEPQYPDKIGRTIAGETGIPTAVLDPVASGPEDAGIDYYETVMRENFSVLEKTLKTR